MKVIVQKAKKSSVLVDGKEFNSISFGLVLLVGFTYGDNEEILEKMARKVVDLRIFEDDNKVMNKSVLDVGGEILSISQFTLYGDTSKGNRPSYLKVLNGSDAIKLYNRFNELLGKYAVTKPGKFGCDMVVNIVNDGPTTIILEKSYEK